MARFTLDIHNNDLSNEETMKKVIQAVSDLDIYQNSLSRIICINADCDTQFHSEDLDKNRLTKEEIIAHNTIDHNLINDGQENEIDLSRLDYLVD
tara:strand:+ start:356 stop:640 length:285 start_codon:yes stop_codon:yes gene_type:complete